jgi:hypothetical protein
MAKNIRVTHESETGRNERFRDGNREITRPQFVREIRQGEHPGYHVRVIHGVPTPASNPDKSKGNNLD